MKRVIDLESNRRVRPEKEPPKHTMGPAERIPTPYDNGNADEPDAALPPPSPRRETDRTSESAARSSSNGVPPNGVPPNGVPPNGVPSNGEASGNTPSSDSAHSESPNPAYRWGSREPLDDASSEETPDDYDKIDTPAPSADRYDRSWEIGPTKNHDESPVPSNRSRLDDQDEDERFASESNRRWSNQKSSDPSEEEEYLFQRELSPRKKTLMEEAYQRKMKLRGRKSISSPDSSQEQFQKENFTQPAYLRKNVHLYSTPPSNDQNVSRYSLDDENNIVGNNRFLHDNVD